VCSQRNSKVKRELAPRKVEVAEHETLANPIEFEPMTTERVLSIISFMPSYRILASIAQK